MWTLLSQTRRIWKRSSVQKEFRLIYGSGFPNGQRKPITLCLGNGASHSASERWLRTQAARAESKPSRVSRSLKRQLASDSSKSAAVGAATLVKGDAGYR